ncbi:hypothetical protein DFH09DRAFT_191780 [Mycena vulgaris]|nr:hypothetical protein DFH09DRAFT_191780 [Mycena vulgaris]
MPSTGSSMIAPSPRLSTIDLENDALTALSCLDSHVQGLFVRETEECWRGSRKEGIRVIVALTRFPCWSYILWAARQSRAPLLLYPYNVIRAEVMEQPNSVIDSAIITGGNHNVIGQGDGNGDGNGNAGNGDGDGDGDGNCNNINNNNLGNVTNNCNTGQISESSGDIANNASTVISGNVGGATTINTTPNLGNEGTVIRVCASRTPEFIVLLVFDIVLTVSFLGMLLLRIRGHRSKKRRSAKPVDVEEGEGKIVPNLTALQSPRGVEIEQPDLRAELEAARQRITSLTVRIRELEAERQPVRASDVSDMGPAPGYSATPYPWPSPSIV